MRQRSEEDAENDIQDIISGEHDSQIKQFTVEGLLMKEYKDQIEEQIAEDSATTGKKWRQQGYDTRELVAGLVEEWTEAYIYSYGNNNTDEPTRAEKSEAKQHVVEVMTKAIQQEWESVFGGVVDKALAKKEHRMKHNLTKENTTMRQRSDDIDIRPYEQALFDDVNGELETATDAFVGVFSNVLGPLRNDIAKDGHEGDFDEAVQKMKETCIDAVDDIVVRLKQDLVRFIKSNDW